MSYRRFFWLPFACAAALAASENAELPAVMSRDADVVSDAAGKPSTTLEKGQSISIIGELSTDEELYIALAGAGSQVAGWVDRSAVSWPDGSPVAGNPDSDAATSRKGKKGKSAQRARAGTEGPNFKSSKNEKKSSRKAPAAEIARSEAPRPEDDRPAQSSTQVEKGLHEMLMGLVTEVSSQKYASTIVKDSSLNRDEKVAALRIFHKYLQEKRAQLRPTEADEAKRAKIQRESEDLLENLASLDTGKKQLKSSTSRKAKAAKGSSRKGRAGKGRKHGRTRGRA